MLKHGNWQSIIWRISKETNQNLTNFKLETGQSLHISWTPDWAKMKEIYCSNWDLKQLLWKRIQKIHFETTTWCLIYASCSNATNSNSNSEKVRVSAGVKTADASRAGVSASTTTASNTTSTTFQRAAEAFVQTDFWTAW